MILTKMVERPFWRRLLSLGVLEISKAILGRPVYLKEIRKCLEKKKLHWITIPKTN